MGWVMMLGRLSLLAVLVVGLGVGSASGLGVAAEAGAIEDSQSQALQILTATLPDGIVGEPYRVRLRASGGRKPYSWSVSTPPLPEGLEFNESSGEIAGTPLYAHLFNFAAHLYDFTVRVTDSSSLPQTATRYFILQVAEPLEVVTDSLPMLVTGFSYRVQFEARGGSPPLKWDVARGSLPAGLELDAKLGILAGTPTRVGAFRFTARVTDTGDPPQTQMRTFMGKTMSPLVVDWKRPPQVEEGGIHGSVEVVNSTREDFDLTVIVMAVNEYGKAFALGYQHFVLEKETISREIPFGFSLPYGDYVVHVDAVAEVAPKNAIYRGRRQQGPMRVE